MAGVDAWAGKGYQGPDPDDDGDSWIAAYREMGVLGAGIIVADASMNDLLNGGNGAVETEQASLDSYPGKAPKSTGGTATPGNDHYDRRKSRFDQRQTIRDRIRDPFHPNTSF